MQHDTKRISRASSLLLCALLGPWVSGCAEDLTADEADGPAATVVTAPDGDAFTTRVDASSSDVWVYFSFDTGGQVISISTDTASGLERGEMRNIPLKVYGASGWDRDAFLMPGVNLNFTPKIEYRNLSVVVLNLRAPSVLLGFRLGGIVGYKFLSRYRVAINLDKSIVQLQARQARRAD